jgi:phosphotransferase system HPr (HPr) family protein
MYLSKKTFAQIPFFNYNFLVSNYFFGGYLYMQTATVTSNQQFHSRPCAIFVQQCNRLSSTLEVEVRGKVANAKSIMSMMSLVIRDGDSVIIRTNGTDEETSIGQLKEMISVKLPDYT